MSRLSPAINSNQAGQDPTAAPAESSEQRSGAEQLRSLVLPRFGQTPDLQTPSNGNPRPDVSSDLLTANPARPANTRTVAVPDISGNWNFNESPGGVGRQDLGISIRPQPALPDAPAGQRVFSVTASAVDTIPDAGRAWTTATSTGTITMDYSRTTTQRGVTWYSGTATLQVATFNAAGAALPVYNVENVPVRVIIGTPTADNQVTMVFPFARDYGGGLVSRPQGATTDIELPLPPTR